MHSLYSRLFSVCQQTSQYLLQLRNCRRDQTELLKKYGSLKEYQLELDHLIQQFSLQDERPGLINRNAKLIKFACGARYKLGREKNRIEKIFAKNVSREIRKYTDKFNNEQLTLISQEILKGFANNYCSRRLKKNDYLACNITFGQQGTAFVHLKGAILGQGSFKKVYLAIKINSASLSEKVAVSRLPKEYEKKIYEENNLALEIQQKTNSPYVVKPSEILISYTGKNEGKIFTPQELMHSQLTQEIAEKRGNIAQTLRLMRDFARGLEAIHQCGYVHRDIKPDNLFLRQTDDNQLMGVVGDLGELQRIEDCKEGTTFAYYQKNSLFLGKNPERLDLWALGVVLLEMALARKLHWRKNASKDVELPFREKGETTACYQQRIDIALEKLFSQSFLLKKPLVRHLIKNLLSVDPDSRMSAKMLADTLDTLLNEEENQSELFDLLLASENQTEAWRVMGAKNDEDVVKILTMEMKQGFRLGDRLSVLDLTSFNNATIESLIEILKASPKVKYLALNEQQSLLPMQKDTPIYEAIIKNRAEEIEKFSIALSENQEDFLKEKSIEELKKMAKENGWQLIVEEKVSCGKNVSILHFDRAEFLKEKSLETAQAIQANQASAYVINGKERFATHYFDLAFLLGMEASSGISGGDLASPSLFLQMAADFTYGLQAIHNAGYVHGDIQSHHLLIVEEREGFRGVVSGLGLALKEGQVGENPTLSSFQSPEKVFNHQAGQTPSMDIWSFGTVIAQLCHIELPEMNRETDSLETYQAKINEVLDPENFIASSLIASIACGILKEMLMADPSQRISAENLSKLLSTMMAELNQCPEYCQHVISQAKDFSEAIEILDLNSLAKIKKTLLLNLKNGSIVGENVKNIDFFNLELSEIETIRQIVSSCPNLSKVRVTCDNSKVQDLGIYLLSLLEDFPRVKNIVVAGTKELDDREIASDALSSQFPLIASLSGWHLTHQSSWNASFGFSRD